MHSPCSRTQSVCQHVESGRVRGGTACCPGRLGRQTSGLGALCPTHKLHHAFHHPGRRVYVTWLSPHLPGRRIYAAAGYAGLRSAEAYQETSAFEMDAVDTYHAFFDGREEADRDYLLLNGDARAERPHRSL